MANTDGITSDIEMYHSVTEKEYGIRLSVQDFDSMDDLYKYALSLGTVTYRYYDYRSNYVYVTFTKPCALKDIRDMSVADYSKLRNALGYDTGYRGILDNRPDSRVISNHSYLPKGTGVLLGSGFMSAPVVPHPGLEVYDTETGELLIKDPVTDKTYASFGDGTFYEKKLTYKDYYWDYVNSKDLVETAENFKLMLDAVTEYQEPNHDMSSWVEEPKETVLKSKKEVSRLPQTAAWEPLVLFAVVILVMFVLQLIGVT